MSQDRFDVPDELWEIVEPLLPKKKKNPEGGRPMTDERKAFAGILYRMRTGIGWRDLPPMFGTKSSVHRKFQEWVKIGVFDKIQKKTLKYYEKRKGILTKRMAADGSYTRAPKGGLTPEQIRRTAVNSVLKSNAEKKRN